MRFKVGVRLCAAAVSLVVVMLAPSPASAFTQADLQDAYSGQTAASEALGTALREQGPQSTAAVEALAAFRASAVRARGDVAALVPADDVQRRYLEVVDRGFVDEIALIDRAAAGTISVNEFVNEFDALALRLQGEIENAVGEAGSGSDAVGETGSASDAAEPSGGESGLPYPLNQWWFWVFVAPEAVLLVLWLLWIVLIGPFVLGAEVARRRRERRGGS